MGEIKYSLMISLITIFFEAPCIVKTCWLINDFLKRSVEQGLLYILTNTGHQYCGQSGEGPMDRFNSHFSDMENKNEAKAS